MRALAAAALLVAIVADGVGIAAAGSAGKEIDTVASRAFVFGPMSIGQAKDVDHARAEGLGLVPPMPLDAYLGDVLNRLLAGSPVKNIPARVYLRASNEWSARSTADANVYVSLGTLLRLDSEDEIAALLAHEAAHVILGHANADVVQGVQQRAIQLSALAVESQRAIAEASGGQLAGGDSSPTGGARVEDQSRALLLNTTLLSPSWTRGQERNADRLGTDLLVRAGYSPQGMVSLLQKQKSFETERAANPQAASLDQQLLGFDATERTQQRIAEAAPTLGAANEVLGTLAGAALGRTKDWATKQLDQGARAHPKTGERIADVQAYVAKEYGDVGAREPQVERWEAAKEADGTVDVLENYIAAIESMGKLASGDLAAARSLAKVGLSGPTRAHAYPNYADAAVQVAGGNPAQARADYEMALAGPGPAGAIYTSLSALYMAAGERDRAVEVMEGGYERLQEPPSLAVPLIETYRRTGRQSEADRLAAQCAMRWPALQSLCRGQAEGRSPDVP